MLSSLFVNAQSERSFSLIKPDLNNTILLGNPENTESEFRHGLSVNVGSILLFHNVGVGYECLITSNRNFKLYAGAGGAFTSFFPFDETKGAYGFLDTHISTGSGNNHFEAALGTFIYANLSHQTNNNITPTFRDITTVLPLVRLGYRYQRQGAGFYFRTGLGFPDMLYLSFGKSFGRINK
jgi:hypothetical protein